MRKYIVIFFLFSLILSTSAQLSSNQGKVYTSFSGIDYVFVFNGINNQTEITYLGTGTTINWYKFSNPTLSVSNQNFISPEDATGYILNVDGKITNIWVIDYQKYLPTLTSIEPENNPKNQCQDVKLLINAAVPIISYSTSTGINHVIPRQFSIKYQTLSWGGSAWKQVDTLISPVILPASQFTVPVPYCNTIFTLSGDQFANDLVISPFTVSSSQYISNAVICKATSVVTIRDAKNEAERPSQASQVDGSAPLDIQFLSNANEPVAQYYNWTIYKGNDLLINRKDKDHRYTFTDAGTYKVKVTASNSNPCSYSDSLTITVSTSQIQVPNVFTPNGDGFNDEFRVAYKSIVKFQCWVYNRWGRQVYYWTDPTKGWDGKINGVDAKPGPYFYVIKAYGSDFDPKSTPNSKTHLRNGEYLLKGDINLLRGVQ